MFGEAVGVEGSAGGRAVSLDTLHRQGPAYGPDGAALGGAAVLRLQHYGPLCRGGREGGGQIQEETRSLEFKPVHTADF